MLTVWRGWKFPIAELIDSIPPMKISPRSAFVSGREESEDLLDPMLMGGLLDCAKSAVSVRLVPERALVSLVHLPDSPDHVRSVARFSPTNHLGHINKLPAANA